MSSDSEDCTAIGKLFHTYAVELNAQYMTVGHAPLAIDRLLDVRTTK